MTSTQRFIAAAVTAPHSLATTAGRDILAQGGSALEAMIAMAGVMAVVYPHRNGIGGDGAWLVREPRGKVHVIDASGMAGSGATSAPYRKAGYDDIPLRGPKAVLSVPGAVAGWDLALEMARAFGGRLPLTDLLAPAIRHARDGTAQSRSSAACLPSDFADLSAQPGFAEAFLVEGKPAAPGSLRRAETLAGTLEQIAHAGLRDFYRGDAGREIAADMARAGVILQRRDLEKYTARLRKPVSLRFGHVTLFQPPPPASGLGLLLALGIHARLGVKPRDEFASVHALVEATKRALSLATPLCIDPAVLDEAPALLLAPMIFEREAMEIARDRAAPMLRQALGNQNVWMGAIDSTGLAVSCCQSLHGAYGSGVVLPRTGVLMHNRGASFSLDARQPHALEPGRYPPAGLAPGLAVQDEGRIIAFGSGDVQIDAQIFLKIAADMGLAEALEAPRFRLAATPDAREIGLCMEDRFDPSLIRALERAGHRIVLDGAPYAEAFAHGGAIARHRDGSVGAAHDPRADGGADGL